VLCVAGALSGLAPVYLRRRLTGRERLVLLEGAGLALAGAAATARVLGEPVLAYLDVLAPALALALAGGRTGCLLAGCCHGRPASVGIVYPEHHAGGGSLAGVRLFPVQAVEAAGLLGIALAGLAALPRAAPGQVLAWFLAAYAVLRFGTEGLRGDRRPHPLGLSAARWTCLAALGLALWLGR
ncbi:MAG: prolipoprotein diacylglyceryl transferase family protein, partial [Gemmatimonadota bacterium]